jgi:hypothetical protein
MRLPRWCARQLVAVEDVDAVGGRVVALKQDRTALASTTQGRATRGARQQRRRSPEQEVGPHETDHHEQPEERDQAAGAPGALRRRFRERALSRLATPAPGVPQGEVDPPTADPNEGERQQQEETDGERRGLERHLFRVLRVDQTGDFAPGRVARNQLFRLPGVVVSRVARPEAIAFEFATLPGVAVTDEEATGALSIRRPRPTLEDDAGNGAPAPHGQPFDEAAADQHRETEPEEEEDEEEERDPDLAEAAQLLAPTHPISDLNTERHDPPRSSAATLDRTAPEGQGANGGGGGGQGSDSPGRMR